MQRLIVKHSTRYAYRSPVELGEHRLMFRPRDSHDLRLLDTSLIIEPHAKLRWLHDVFDNSVALATFDGKTSSLFLESQIVLDRYPFLEPNFPIEEFARHLPFSYPVSEIPDLGRTIERHYPDPERKITEWTRRFLNPSGGEADTESFLRYVNHAIRDEFTYTERPEPGVQTPVETLERGGGSCRDYALFMMEVVRSVGLAARFVSGYVYDPFIDGQRSDIVGAGSTHAWLQVYLPGAGWVEFDPTNAQVGARNLVPVAVAREPQQAMPVMGSFTGADDAFISMDVKVTVRNATMMEGAA